MTSFTRCCGWRLERIDTRHGSYHELPLGRGLGGGMVEGAAERSIWVPYVATDDVHGATGRALASGASVLLEPREGPAGWRSLISSPAGGEIALWQHKR